MGEMLLARGEPASAEFRRFCEQTGDLRRLISTLEITAFGFSFQAVQRFDGFKALASLRNVHLSMGGPLTMPWTAHGL